MNAKEKKVKWNYPADYVRLTLLARASEQKTVSLEQVEEMESYMTKELASIESDTIYLRHDCIYAINSVLFDIQDREDGKMEFTLEKGVTSLQLSQNVATSFDERQLSTVLPKETVAMLQTLVPQDEKLKIHQLS